MTPRVKQALIEIPLTLGAVFSMFYFGIGYAVAHAPPPPEPTCYQAIRLEPGYGSRTSYTIYTCRELFVGNNAMAPALVDCDVVGAWDKWKADRLRWPTNVTSVSCPPPEKK